MSERIRYAMLIEWSKLDDAYVVSFPEWERAGYLANTHGATYTEAAQRGEEMLAALIEGAQAGGETLPAPAYFDDHAYKPGKTVEGIARANEALARELEMRADVDVRCEALSLRNPGGYEDVPRAGMLQLYGCIPMERTLWRA